MYKNYGDVNFFENGCLVEVVNDTTFNIIRCALDPDTGLYFFNPSMFVDVDDSWIDNAGVMDFIGMSAADYDPLFFAIGCTDYYAWENFGMAYGLRNPLTPRDEIVDILSHYDIDRENVEIEKE